MEESCCTCAARLSDVPRFAPGTEKPYPEDRRLECCGRIICGRCIHNNVRFRTYCPYCQTSNGPSSLPQGLKDPPSYDAAVPPRIADAPPPYTPAVGSSPPRAVDEKAPIPDPSGETKSSPPTPPQDEILHFLNHDTDTVTSLSLRYGVPASAIRAANRIGSDHLLLARRAVVIPTTPSSSTASGSGARTPVTVSLSPRPVEGEEEELRKGRIRRWQVACKEADYDVAVLYLEQAGYDVDAAVEAYFADEAWEKAHPLDATGAGAARTRANKGKARRFPWNRVSQAAYLARAGPSER